MSSSQRPFSLNVNNDLFTKVFESVSYHHLITKAFKSVSYQCLHYKGLQVCILPMPSLQRPSSLYPTNALITKAFKSVSYQCPHYKGLQVCILPMPSLQKPQVCILPMPSLQRPSSLYPTNALITKAFKSVSYQCPHYKGLQVCILPMPSLQRPSVLWPLQLETLVWRRSLHSGSTCPKRLSLHYYSCVLMVLPTSALIVHRWLCNIQTSDEIQHHFDGN